MAMKKFHCLGFVFLCGVFCPGVLGETGCPSPEDVRPCSCNNSPYTILECSGVRSEEEIRSVFQHSTKYTYKEVHLSFSTLKYLPQEMFDNTVVKELYIQNSTLNALFDTPPDGLHELYKLHLENTLIKELSHWELISHLTHLLHLDILHNPIDTIDSTFGEHVSKTLTHLSLLETGTKEIMEGAFLLFPNLNKVEITRSRLKQLSRGYFTNPSNIQHMYFNDNELQSIPSDMFTNMPQLKSVGLRNNYLRTIPESAFEGVNVPEISFFAVEGNPLRCDCSLLWLVKNKPEYIKGSCSTPLRLHDKELKDLVADNLKCS